MKKTIVLSITAIILFGAGFVVGDIVHLSGRGGSNNTVLAGTSLSDNGAMRILTGKKGSVSKSDEVSFDLFWNVWDKVKTKHVDQSAKDVDMFYGAISGMVATLDDPYSIFFPPKPAGEFIESVSGKFEGIGAEIGIRDGRLMVIAPLPESPAERAGVKSGDLIMAVDGKDTNGMTVEGAISIIRGDKGTTVVLTVRHKGEEVNVDIPIIRDKIQVPSIYKQDKDGDIVYVRISQFNQETVTEFDKIVREVITSDKKGFILDLRSNPGGYLESAVRIASEWVGSGVIVSEKLIGGTTKEHVTNGANRMHGIPTVVLVDGGSASASEIVAGALQDYDMATIVGEKTFGKGSVQDFEVFEDGSALKVTIAKWLTPLEREIDGKGIEPDVVLDVIVGPRSGEVDDKTASSTEQTEIVDFAIEKAMEILNGGESVR
jgi:carboxyl-terminal processing protease